MTNLKTTTFFQNLLNAHFKSTATPPTKMRVGMGTTTPVIGDSALTKKIPINSTETADACDATTGWTGGTDSVVALNTTTFKVGTGALSLSKTGTAGTVMSMSKTTTSLDFTSKELWCWVYITDLADLVSAGTALVIRFGSDNLNYYYYNIAITSLSTGWNAIVFNTSTASGTTGAPTIAACDYTYFAFNTDLAADTIAANRILIDNIILASATDYDMALTAGYPIVDTTELNAETSVTLATTDAVGFPISECGELNAANGLQSHNVFDPESKSSTDIFIIVEKTKVRNR